MPDDPPPIAIENIEVLRITKPEFSVAPWPDMTTVEDCWMGSAHDAKPLTNPLSCETLMWTGETLFGRVLPKPPKGKAWCNGELVRVRRGTQRSPDIHPLHWETKYREILLAQNWRSIPRRKLEKMPAAGATRGYDAAATLFLRAKVA